MHRNYWWYTILITESVHFLHQFDPVQFLSKFYLSQRFLQTNKYVLQGCCICCSSWYKKNKSKWWPAKHEIQKRVCIPCRGKTYVDHKYIKLIKTSKEIAGKRKHVNSFKICLTKILILLSSAIIIFTIRFKLYGYKSYLCYFLLFYAIDIC